MGRSRQDAAAGGKRRAEPDGGEHQQGGDEQLGCQRRGWEERQGPKEKKKGKGENQNGRKFHGFPRWGEGCHRRCGGGVRKGEPMTDEEGGCS